MAQEGKTYHCDVCGQRVRVVKSGVGTLVCCNQPMRLVEETAPEEKVEQD